MTSWSDRARRRFFAKISGRETGVKRYRAGERQSPPSPLSQYASHLRYFILDRGAGGAPEIVGGYETEAAAEEQTLRWGDRPGLRVVDRKEANSILGFSYLQDWGRDRGTRYDWQQGRESMDMRTARSVDPWGAGSDNGGWR
jgi:hypothetical protein